MSVTLPIKLEADTREDLKGMTREALRGWVVETLGEQAFRGDQIFGWIHGKGSRSFSEMSNLSLELRERLEAESQLVGLTLDGVMRSKDGTRKLLMQTQGGDRIESVLMPMDHGYTQCVSSQVGCKMGCDYCFTAKMARKTNLRASEIVDQVLWAQKMLDEDGEGARISNIVYMGMGEPMDNYDNVVASLKILMDKQGQGFASRRITVSSTGVVPKLRLFGHEVDVNLAISLNASSNEQRKKVIPITRKWSLDSLMETLHDYPLGPRRRITMEYVMLADFNDSLEDAARVAELLRGLRCKLNLIPFNPWPGTTYRRPSPEVVNRFAQYLLREGYTVTVRYSKGEDIGAACGQLDGDQNVS